MCGGPAMVDPGTELLTCMLGHYSFQGRTATPEEREAVVANMEAWQEYRDACAAMPDFPGPGTQVSHPGEAARSAIGRRRSEVERLVARSAGPPDERLVLELRVLRAAERVCETMAAVRSFIDRSPGSEGSAR